MKKIAILLFGLLLSGPLAYGQDNTGSDNPAISQSRSGAITYDINRKSNMVEYPYGYSQAVLKSTPLRLSLIVLQEGEKVMSLSAGDTRRWKVTQSYQGNSGEVTPVIQVKPVTDNISTNLIITTDRRTYDITLEAPSINNNSGNPQEFFTRRISFYYPDEENFGSIGSKPKAAKGAVKPSAAKTVNYEDGVIDIANANMRYQVKEGKYGFPWKPEAVYDNGTHVFIKIPNTIEAQALPALFVVNQAGERQNINLSFNPETRILKADRLFDKAVLIRKFRHPGFLGLGTVTDEKELFLIREN